MARARNIKPAFFTNELLGVADPMICLTFAGLWCLADKFGVLEDRPLRVKAELFPYRDSLDVNGYLTELARLGFIVRYENDGRRFIQVLNFKKHQSPHNTEKGKGFPFFTDPKSLILEGNGYLTVKKPCNNSEKRVLERPDSLIPDSLIPDSLIPDSLIPDSLIPDSLIQKHLSPDKSDDGTPGADPVLKSGNVTAKQLVSEGCNPQHAKDWLAVRKTKKAPLTVTAWESVKAEAGKAGMTPAKAVEMAASNGWQGFKAAWAENDKPAKTPAQTKHSGFDSRDYHEGLIDKGDGNYGF